MNEPEIRAYLNLVRMKRRQLHKVDGEIIMLNNWDKFGSHTKAIIKAMDKKEVIRTELNELILQSDGKYDDYVRLDEKNREIRTAELRIVNTQNTLVRLKEEKELMLQNFKV